MNVLWLALLLSPHAAIAPSSLPTSRSVSTHSQPSRPPPSTRPPSKRIAAVRSATRSAPSEPPAAPYKLSIPPRKYQPVKLPSLTPNSMFWGQVIGMLFALVVVLLLIFVMLRWAAKRMGVTGYANLKLLQICDRLALEPKKGLWVVKAADQYLLLATHEHGITLLERLDTSVIEAHIQSPKEDQQESFWKLLRRKSTPQRSKLHTDAAPQDAKDPTSAAIPTQFEVVNDGKPKSPSSET